MTQPQTQAELEQEVEAEAKRLGERFALLLTTANLPDDVKQGIIQMLPGLTLEQTDKLTHALEKNIEGGLPPDMRDLVKALNESQETYEAERSKAENQVVKELSEIEALLDKAEEG